MKWTPVSFERVVSTFLVLVMISGLATAGAIALKYDDVQDPDFDGSGEQPTPVSAGDGPPPGPEDPRSSQSVEDTSTVDMTSEEEADGGVTDEVEYPGVEPVKKWFEEVSRGTGLIFEGDGNTYGNVPLEGSPTGVYVSDVDRDGWPDVLTMNTRETVLFDNEGGEFVLSRNLSEYGDFKSALFLDHDNDGFEELYLMSDEESVFLENEGGELSPEEAGLPESFDSVRGASAADYDGDGCLDVFIVQANEWSRTRPEGYDSRDVPIKADNGGKNLLYNGECDGFENVTREAGIRGKAWSLTTSFVDIDRDGLPDIHVANDFNRDVVYFNRGDGSFRREVLPGFTNRNGMSSEVADVNGDGDPEVFVTNIHGDSMIPANRYGGRIQGNYLLRYDAEAGFRDVAPEHGLVEGGFGWAAVIEDLNNDGNLDVIHSATDRTGNELPPLWRGRSDAEEFERLNSSAAGLRASGFVGSADLDFDRDGDVDVILADTRERYAVYRNQNQGSYLQVRVEPARDNTAIGSTVTVVSGDQVATKQLTSNVDYMSQGWRTLHFGLDDSETVDRVDVTRPDGATQTLEDVRTGKRIVVEPGEASG